MRQLELNRIHKIALILFGTVVLSLFNSSAANAQAGRAPKRTTNPRVQNATVKITDQGYQPVSIRLRRGVPARITFLRTSDATCAKEVVLADYGITRELPLNQAVVVRFTPKHAGEFGFTCGMNMHRGKLIVR